MAGLSSYQAVCLRNTNHVSGEQPMATKKHETKQAKKPVSWTIMLYIAADGNIANFGIESLKQLNQAVSLPAGCECENHAMVEDEATVTVAAQFAVDAPGGQQIPRYIFSPRKSAGNLESGFDSYLNAPDEMTEQESLTSFLQWAFANDDCKADKYALILWGHGPELLMQPPPLAGGQNQSGVLYLTPEQLRVALHEGLPQNHRKLDIIGFDACSMSMFEVAYEVRDYAHYMVASQEEVPDPSFPYDSLVELFRRKGNRVETLLADAVDAYVAAYSSYITNSVTGMKPVTLSALRLGNCVALEGAIRTLSAAIATLAKHDPALAGLLLAARKFTRDFVGGLYVDIVDLATNLITVLSIGHTGSVLGSAPSAAAQRAASERATHRNALIVACAAVVEALEINPTRKDLLVLANSSADSGSNGVSLYLPYCSDAQLLDIVQPPVKGGLGTFGAKAFSAVINAAQPDALMHARRELIINTEGYYENLELALDTGWYRFIVTQWAKILIAAMPKDLDLRYSAQQAAVNACRPPVRLSPKV
jgi:hypothetical protein